LTLALASIFETQGRLSLEKVASSDRREQRNKLRHALAGADRFGAYIEAHVALLGLSHRAVPMHEPVLQLLRKADVIEADTDAAAAQKFCEQNLKADDCVKLFRIGRASAAKSKKSRPATNA
jgi:hypothetical protein